jgi:hypothetical protein
MVLIGFAVWPNEAVRPPTIRSVIPDGITAVPSRNVSVVRWAVWFSGMNRPARALVSRAAVGVRTAQSDRSARRTSRSSSCRNRDRSHRCAFFEEARGEPNIGGHGDIIGCDIFDDPVVGGVSAFRYDDMANHRVARRTEPAVRHDDDSQPMA